LSENCSPRLLGFPLQFLSFDDFEKTIIDFCKEKVAHKEMQNLKQNRTAEEYISQKGYNLYQNQPTPNVQRWIKDIFD
jgi:hypothetical protein